MTCEVTSKAIFKVTCMVTNNGLPSKEPTHLGTPIYGQTRTSRELLSMRAFHHNILVNERSWDNQIELIRASTESNFAYCIYPTVHANMFKDTLNTVAEHKVTCWPGNTSD